MQPPWLTCFLLLCAGATALWSLGFFGGPAFFWALGFSGDHDSLGPEDLGAYSFLRSTALYCLCFFWAGWGLLGTTDFWGLWSVSTWGFWGLPALWGLWLFEPCGFLEPRALWGPRLYGAAFLTGGPAAALGFPSAAAQGGSAPWGGAVLTPPQAAPTAQRGSRGPTARLEGGRLGRVSAVFVFAY